MTAAFPRRFYLLVFFSAFALLSTFAFLNRGGGYGISVVGDGWGGRFGGKNGGSGGDVGSGGDGGSGGDVESAGAAVGNGDFGGGEGAEEKKEENHEEAKTITGNMMTALAGNVNGNGKSDGIPAALLKPSPRKELRVAVVESSGENEEATAALIYTFGRQPLAPVSLYLQSPRFQIGEIISEFNLPVPIATNKSSLDFADAVSGPELPQLLISSSCEKDVIHLHDSFEKLLKAGKTYLYCVIHDADAWREGELVDKIRPWLQSQMVDFVTLSSHTAHHLRTEAIANWDFNATVTVQWLAPVFPVNMPESADGRTVQATNQFQFALYTDTDPAQNNYTDIFASLVSVLEEAKNVTNDLDTQQSRNVQLHLLGRHKAPEIPSSLKGNVIYNPAQSYKDYYTQLSHAFALIPYLPLPDFLRSRASSAIPAALIAGAPLVANVELAEAYSYLPQDAVWMSTIGEGEMDTVTRVVQWSAPEHWRKRRVVRERCARIIQRNEELVGVWVEQAQRRIERAGWRMGKDL